MAGALSAPSPADGTPVPPPLSLPQAEYYRTHPAEWDKLLKQMPTFRTIPMGPTQSEPAPVAANTWTRTTHIPPVTGLSNPLLLTNGTVIIHASCGSNWVKLTPDSTGSYINGTWSIIASLPAGYTPLYFASQILNDGRVVANGGEYNNNSGCKAVWQKNGAVYNPLTNLWKPLAAPPGWTTIGDAQSIILPSGKYMLADCCTTNEAILNNPDSSPPSWSATGGGKFDVNDEEGWALLQTGKVLTTDAYVFTGTCGLGSELYTPDPVTGIGTWVSAGTVTTQLSDCNPPNKSFEVGPIVVRTNDTAVAFSGVTSGVAGTSIYLAGARPPHWTSGPNIPTIGGKNFNLADAPAVALPCGGIFFAGSTGLFAPPTQFFEFTTANTIVTRANTPNAPGEPAFVVNLLLLPNGQVLQTENNTNDVEIYQPAGCRTLTGQPVITALSASTLTHGHTYIVKGTQLSGITHGVYGDDEQAATNFPLIRLTNTSTGTVFYARTFSFTSRSDKPNQASSARFQMPTVITKGNYNLQAIANGIASATMAVTVN